MVRVLKENRSHGECFTLTRMGQILNMREVPDFDIGGDIGGIHPYVSQVDEIIESYYFVMEHRGGIPQNIIQNLKVEFENLGYDENDDWYDFCYSEEGSDDDICEEDYNEDENELIDEKLKVFKKHLQNILFEYYLKVRIGHRKYGDVDQDDCLYFRIESSNFDWYDIIWNFTQRYYQKYNIKSITIERITNKDKYEYKTYKAKDGTEYNQMPIREFLSEEHGGSPNFS